MNVNAATVSLNVENVLVLRRGRGGMDMRRAHPCRGLVGSSRCGDTRGTLRPDHHQRAFGIVRERLAGRAEQQSGEPAATSVANDHELSCALPLNSYRAWRGRSRTRTPVDWRGVAPVRSSKALSKACPLSDRRRTDGRLPR